MGNSESRWIPTDSETLNIYLELITKLENCENLKQKVIAEINKKARKWVKVHKKRCNKTKEKQKTDCKDTEHQQGVFACDNETYGYLSNTITKGKELYCNILKSTSHPLIYKEHLPDHEDDCPEVYANLVIEGIFSFFGCLYYMYYECSDDGSIIGGGGEWKEEHVNGESSEDSKGGKCEAKHVDGTCDTGKDLNQWLRDEAGKGLPEMIPRDFKGVKLSTMLGKQLFGTLCTNNILYFFYGGQLQFALYYMLFLPNDWKRGMTAHTLLFIKAFCKMVLENRFKERYKDNSEFRSACLLTTEKIDGLIQCIFPVAYQPKVKYEDLLRRGRIVMYLYWLRQHLRHFIASLKDMVVDVPNWKATALETSKTYGPFPWGFVFKYQTWQEQDMTPLCTSLMALIDALETLETGIQSVGYDLFDDFDGYDSSDSD